MASLKEFLQEIGQKTLSRLEDSTSKVNQNFTIWLEEFYPKAIEQIKNLNIEAWCPKTPKSNASKRRSSRKTKKLSEVNIASVKSVENDTQVLLVAKSTSRPNTKLRRRLKTTKTDSSTQSETEDDDKNIPPPEPVRSKRNTKKLSEGLKMQRQTKVAKTDSSTQSEAEETNKQHIPPPEPVHSTQNGNQASPNPKAYKNVKANKTDSSTQSETEENSDKVTMPPPEPIRSKRVVGQSSQKSANRSSKHLVVSLPKLKITPRNGKDQKSPFESSMHLVLESISTDEGTPVMKTNDTTFKQKSVVVEKSVVDVEIPQAVKPNDVRRTVVIKALTKGKKDEEISFQTPLIVSEPKSENESLQSKNFMNAKEKVNRAPLVTNNKTVNNLKVANAVQSENHTTPRLRSLNDAKRSLHNNFIICAKTPQSPKQLFSAYAKGDIKQKALAFERAQLNTPVLHESGNSPCTTKQRRSSMRKRSQQSSVLILAKSARMSTSARRSSLMRHRLSTVYNNCHKTRISDKENESVLLQVCKESEEEDARVKAVNGVQPPVVPSPVGDVKQEHKDVKEMSCNSSEFGKLSSTTENVSPAVGVGNTSEEPSPVTSTSVCYSPEHTTSALNTSKVYSSGQAVKRFYPASETKMPNKVTVLVSQFDKKYASSSKAQGFIKKKFSGSTAITNSGFKSVQKPGFSVPSKTSREVLLEMRRAKEEEAYRKRQQLLKEKIEESKRKNEEKHQKVKENRLKEQRASETLRRTLEKQEQNQMAAKKTILQKQKSIVEAKKNLRLKREMELEKRRKEEEEQRIIRQKRVEELRQQELAELKKQQEKREQEARKASAAAKVKPLSCLNRTYTAEKSPDGESYDITPHRSELPKEELKDSNNYDIEDLKSGDETDDEKDPRKIIPNWAQGVSLRIAVINQHRNPPDLNKLFPEIETCHLEKIFKIQRSRFQARTSSAVWHVPPIQHNH